MDRRETADRLGPLPPTLDDRLRSWFPDLHRRATERGLRARHNAPIGPQDLSPEDDRFLFENLVTKAKERYRAEHHWRHNGYSETSAVAQILETPESKRLFAVIRCYYAAVFDFALSGRKTYFFSPSLVERLAHTELNVVSELVHLPFRTCLFVFDDPVSRENYTRLTEDAIVASEASGARLPISVYTTLFDGDDGSLGVLWCLGAMAGRKKAHLVASRSIELVAGQRVEDALRTRWAVGADGGKEAQDHVARNDEFFGGKESAFQRLLLNAILYLSSNHPDISSLLMAKDRVTIPPTSTKARRAAMMDRSTNSSSRLSYIEVGAHFAPFSRPSGQMSPGRQLASRHLVRGHWRARQHYGPARTLTKQVFIEPYWRGPDFADVVNRPYLVTLGDLSAETGLAVMGDVHLGEPRPSSRAK